MPFDRGGQSTADVGTWLFDNLPPKGQRKRGKIFALKQTVGAKNTGQVIWKPARKKAHEGLCSQKFSTDRAKNNCLRAAYLPKRKNRASPFTDYSVRIQFMNPLRGNYFFPAVTFCGRCAILPKRNGKNFRRKKLNYCIRSRQIRTKNRLGCKPLYGSTESIMAVNSSSATACILRGAAKTQRRMRRPFLPKADRRRNGQNKCRKQRPSPRTAQRRLNHDPLSDQRH